MKWAALLISLAAHAAVLALVHVRVSRPVPKPARKSKPISVDIVTLPPPPAARTAAAAARAQAPPRTGAREAIRSRVPARENPPETETPAGKHRRRPPGPSALSMRTPPVPGRRGGERRAHPLLPVLPGSGAGGPVPPAPGLNPLGPITVPRVPGPKRAKPKFGPRFSSGGGGTYKSDRGPFVAKIDRDGHMHFDDKANLQVHGLGGGFDLTDWAMRHAGMDPYSYRKMKLLDRTRAARERMAQAAKQEDLRAAVRVTPKYLRAIWRTQKWSFAERRRLLFQLWDECAESGPHDVVAAANEVRATILAFIRRTLPAGSPHAYSDAELGALNAHRASEQRFEPYASSRATAAPGRDR